MNLPTFDHPYCSLLDGPTPIQRLDRLGERYRSRGIDLYVKRDDHMSLGGGGNKLRKLEFLLGVALEQRVDTLITVGGLQSNHARLTAAACARLGLACELVLTRTVPRRDSDYETNGNVLLDGLFGARAHVFNGGVNALQKAESRAQALRLEGRKVMVIPVGGSTGIGCLGYARCAYEIAAQEIELGIHFDVIVCANGSGGTHGGLMAGRISQGEGFDAVRSYSVLSGESDARTVTAQLVSSTLKEMGFAQNVDPAALSMDGSYLGEGYGIPTKAMEEAVKLMARQEGLLLDPVYSGKAFAGLLADIERGGLSTSRNVLFLMTGGIPGLYAYRELFANTVPP